MLWPLAFSTSMKRGPSWLGRPSKTMSTCVMLCRLRHFHRHGLFDRIRIVRSDPIEQVCVERRMVLAIERHRLVPRLSAAAAVVEVDDDIADVPRILIGVISDLSAAPHAAAAPRSFAVERHLVEDDVEGQG